MENNNKKLKILLAPVEIAGILTTYQEGLNLLGHKADIFLIQEHPFKYNYKLHYLSKLYINLRKINSKFIQILQKNKNKKILFALIKPFHTFYKILISSFIWIIYFYLLLKYDIYIFNFGMLLIDIARDLIKYFYGDKLSFIPEDLDFKIIKFLKKFGIRKKVICIIGLGSESRPAYLCGFLRNSNEKFPDIEFIYQRVKNQYKRLELIQQYADEIIIDYYNSQFLKRKGIAINCVWGTKSYPHSFNNIINNVNEKDKIKILHSPSHPLGKGTAFIEKCIENIKSQGYPIELKTITNVTNDRVKEELLKCDMVIDQVYSDTLMPVFTIEAMFAGKPCITSGYGLENLKKLIPQEFLPPIQYCQPDQLEQTIKFLLDNPDYRKELSEKAQKFAQNILNPQSIAQRLIKIINSDIPQEWIIDPTKIKYIYGAGYSKEELKIFLKQYLDKYGKEGLMLTNRQDLIEEILKFVNSQ